MKSATRNQNGFSLIEVMVGAAILSVTMLAAATFFSSQLKTNNFIEFQAKRDQLNLSIPGLVLKDAKNCGCIFKGAKFPANPSNSSLNGFTQPTVIGPYSDSSNCSSPITNPLIPGNGISLQSATISSINKSASGGYFGNMVLMVDTTKEVLGPHPLAVNVAVALQGTVSGGTVTLTGCSLEASGGGSGGIAAQGGIMLTTQCRHGQSCDSQAANLCATFAGSSNYCLADTYQALADGGDKNIGVKGYSCVPTLCPSGGNTQLTMCNYGLAEGYCGH